MTVLHVLHTPMREIHRAPDGEPRWCFYCRAVREHAYVVDDVIEQPSYYEPYRSIRCGTCDHVDADLFPGRFREWT